MSSTALKKAMTDEGIFSTLFASEFLLKDLVKDATIDIMHIFLASGVIPYTLSWLTDIMIPANFTWLALDAAVKVENGRKLGGHIPKLVRSGNQSRSAAKMALTAGEGMAFALARKVHVSTYMQTHSSCTTLHTTCSNKHALIPSQLSDI
jgi:hypothetical protein